MNDQIFTDSYTQIYWKIIKIIVGKNILGKWCWGYQVKFPVMSLIYDWIFNFWNGYKVPSKKFE